ncbi:anthranilate phosphoribosyltransferase, partial [Desulfocurvibacter africanus]
MKIVLENLAQGLDLTSEQAEGAFGRLMAGELSEGQAGAMLMGLRAKGETPQELAA